jgi:CBS domain containing-hemolysin-like protein
MRRTLQTVRRGSTGADVEALCAATGFSRFPVGDDGDLLGYLHIKDVLEADERRRAVVEDKWIRPFALVHDDDLLRHPGEAATAWRAHGEGRRRHREYAQGAATLEDVIELVGEIRDSAHLGHRHLQRRGTRGTDG